MLIYEMTIGQPPFMGKTEEELFMGIMKKKVNLYLYTSIPLYLYTCSKYSSAAKSVSKNKIEKWVGEGE